MKLREYIKLFCFLTCCWTLPPEDVDGVPAKNETSVEKKTCHAIRREKYASCPNLMRLDDYPSQNFSERKQLGKDIRLRPIPNRRPTPFIYKCKSRKEGITRDGQTQADFDNFATLSRLFTDDIVDIEDFELDLSVVLVLLFYMMANKDTLLE